MHSRRMFYCLYNQSGWITGVHINEVPLYISIMDAIGTGREIIITKQPNMETSFVLSREVCPLSECPL